jgi:hypothetical protein
MVSRNEGYRRSSGKEEISLSIVETFLKEELGLTTNRITDPLENYEKGDLLLGSGFSVEVKSQPIDPDKYHRNFVEVAEVTSNPKHSQGVESLSRVLKINLDDLQNALVSDKRLIYDKQSIFGYPPSLSNSILSMTGSTATIYVNPSNGGSHIFIYPRRQILDFIRTEVLTNGFVRGAGQSNEDTLAVFIPTPRLRWRKKGSQWECDFPLNGTTLSRTFNG